MRFTRLEVRRLSYKMTAMYYRNYDRAVVAGIQPDGKLTASNVEGRDCGFMERIGFFRPGETNIQSIASTLRANGHTVV